MQVAVRSYLTAGIAALGATAIAIAPIQPTLPYVHAPISHIASVELAATVNPIEAWLQVVQGAATNTVGLVNQVVADPAPVVVQLVTNQLANLTLLGDTAQATIQSLVAAAEALPSTLQTAAQQLAAGQVVDAFNTVVLYALTSALGLVGTVGTFTEIAQNAVQNLANVIGVIPDGILALGLGVAAPVIGTLTAGAQTVQDVVDAFGAGDPVGALSAIVNAPAALTGAFLNGNPNAFFTAGLLTPWQGDAYSSGPIGIALFLRDEIAGALHPVGQQPAAIESASVNRVGGQREIANATVAGTPDAGADAGASTVKTTPRTGSPTKRTARGGDTTTTTGTGRHSEQASANASASASADASTKAQSKPSTGGKHTARHEKASAGAGSSQG